MLMHICKIKPIEIYPDVTRESEYLHLENMTADNYEELN